MRLQLVPAMFTATVVGLPAFGGELCRPSLSFNTVQLSEVQNLQRKWTAVLDVDASPCATASGSFELKLVRLKENAKDLEFAESLTWQTAQSQKGRIEVSIDFWMDEAVLDHSIGYVAPCACR